MTNKPQEDYTKTEREDHVAPEVLLAIARLTTLEVPGVSRMSNTPAESTVG